MYSPERFKRRTCLWQACESQTEWMFTAVNYCCVIKLSLETYGLLLIRPIQGAHVLNLKLDHHDRTVLFW